MKPFQLDTVLHLRKRLENLAQEQLAKARHEEDAIKAEITTQEKNYDQISQQLAHEQQQGMTIEALLHREEQLIFIREQITSLNAELATKQHQVKRCYQNLVVKSKEHQVMKKLKKKQQYNWQQYLNKKEAAALDEMAVIFHDRR